MKSALPRRTLLGLAAAAAAASPGLAQTIIPDEGIDILVGFQSTGGPDVIARRLAAELERRTGRRVGVENRPGDGGARPGETLKRQPPDGTTLALFSSATFVARLVDPDFKFDPVVDLAPICLIGIWPIALVVSPTLGITSLEAYRRWLKSADSAQRKIGNMVPHAFFDTFDRILSRELDVSVRSSLSPGDSALVNDLESGRVPAAVAGIPSLLEHHRGGRLRILMTSSPSRPAVAPDVPTARELGLPGLEIIEWYGFFARAGTPAPLIEEWNRHIVAVLNEPVVAGELSQMGLDISPSTPQELAVRLDHHLAEWKARMIAVGIQPLQ